MKNRLISKQKEITSKIGNSSKQLSSLNTGQLIKELLTFNQKEQRGIIFLLTLYSLLVLGTILYPFSGLDRPVDFSGFEKEIKEFELHLAGLDSAEARDRENRYKKFRSAYFGGDSGFRNSGKKIQEIFVIELNSADTFELQRLRGIGPGFARRIVKYRERLGGYLNKSQVKEVWGMDTARYNRISPNLTVNPDSVHKIHLNIVTFKELLFHPYFPFELTKSIMLYRKDHKKFSTLEELMTIPGMHDTTFRKIIPYLSVE
jgi:competence ComEA-like helix-hairpin-helix protein